MMRVKLYKTEEPASKVDAKTLLKTSSFLKKCLKEILPIEAEFVEAGLAKTNLASLHNLLKEELRQVKSVKYTLEYTNPKLINYTEGYNHTVRILEKTKDKNADIKLASQEWNLKISDKKIVANSVNTTVIPFKYKTIELPGKVTPIKISFELNEGDNFSKIVQQQLLLLRKQIQDMRKRQSKIATREKTYAVGGEQIPLIGVLDDGRWSVHLEKGTFLNGKVAIAANKILKVAKAPKSSDRIRYFGVEIEFFSQWDRNRLAFELAKVGLADNCHLKGDGSIQAEPGYNPHELNFMVGMNNYEEKLMKLCEVLKLAGAKTNKSCGLHVHIDQRYVSEDHRNVQYFNLIKFQKILFSMNPKTRRNTQYSKMFTPTPEQLMSYLNQPSEHYMGISTSYAYNKYKTFEIRIHCGTTNFNKINYWLKLIRSICTKTTKTLLTDKEFENFEKVIQDFSLEPSLCGYMSERMLKFLDAPKKVDEEDEYKE